MPPKRRTLAKKEEVAVTPVPVEEETNVELEDTSAFDAAVEDEDADDFNEENPSTILVKKKLDELTIDEIKSELEFRKLNFDGDDYAILHERLTDALVEEGLDVDMHEFEFEEDVDYELENEEDLTKDVPQNGENTKPQNGGEPLSDSEKKSEETEDTEVTKKKEEKRVYKEVEGHHAWVSGLGTRAKAGDLKKFFSRFAKVVSAKIVANAKNNTRCYGYVTVEAKADLDKCVKRLHRSRFDGYTIEVEVTKFDPTDTLRKSESKEKERREKEKEKRLKRNAERKNQAKVNEAKKKEIKPVETKNGEKKVENKKVDLKKRNVNNNPRRRPSRERNVGSQARPRSRGGMRGGRGGSRPSPRPVRRGRSPPRRLATRRAPSPRAFSSAPPFLPQVGPPLVPAFANTLRRFEKEREMEEHKSRELERRRRIEMDAIEREKQQLRMEKEKLERDRLELMRLERERVKKEMEEIAARKERELADRRRREDLAKREEDQRRREELLRRDREVSERSRPRVAVPPSATLYDPRAPLPVDDYHHAPQTVTAQADKYMNRRGMTPPPRHDDRRHSDRDPHPPSRREPHVREAPRDERRQVDPWASKRDEPRYEAPMPRVRSRSPPPQRSSSNSYADRYSSASQSQVSDPWNRPSQPLVISASPVAYTDRRPPPQSSRPLVGLPPSSRPMPPPESSTGSWPPSSGGRSHFPAYQVTEPQRSMGGSSYAQSSAGGYGRRY